ncbi:MAG: arginine--tRNA ligase [Candidatus Omnitrophica bacterium]|nr:arginine--tRNA ligase [Candidatus Omnitrophota bacterium]
MYYGGIEQDIISLLEGSVKSVIKDLGVILSSPDEIKVELDIPKEKIHGDISSNIAMRISKIAKRSPVELAKLITGRFSKDLEGSTIRSSIGRAEVKAPGFINFFLSESYLHGVLSSIEKTGDSYGSSSIGSGSKLQIEFVSANPTGPLTIAHGRQAAIGDSLANILSFLGYDVTREYYLNDEGTQMNILGNSIRIRYKELCGAEEPFPEDGYKGTYVYDVARAFRDKFGDKYKNEASIEIFREFGLEWMMADIRKDLEDFGVKFDVWFSQRKLRESGKVEEALGFLRKQGFIYEQEGAVWFRSTDFGDDKDRVVIKSDGSLTYLAPDIAYHREKFARGFTRLIDIWGPDHHGYIPRMKAAIQALGHPVDSLSVLIVQLASLYRGGQQVRMSTRAGEFVTLREVMDEVGKDVGRFCFTMRRISSHLDFDLDVIKKESSENPVFYIQYAHARIWSILDYAKDASISDKFDPGLLKEPEEMELIRALRQFPLVVNLSARHLEPYVILQYLQDLASMFHSFYNKHRVVGDDAGLSRARIALVDCVRIVLANGLRLLGVSLPKKM